MSGRADEPERGTEGDGRALLVEGWIDGADSIATSRSPIAQLGELLLASGGFETVRRLTPRAVERYRPSRLALRFHVENVLAQSERLALVALCGKLISAGGELCFDATPKTSGGYGLDSLALSWLSDRLVDCSRLLVFLELDAQERELDTAGVLARCRTGGETQLVAVAGAASGLLQAVVDGLRGGAAEAQSGKVSFASLRAFLARVPGVALSEGAGNTGFFLPPSPLGLWGLDAALDRETEGPSAHELAGRTLPGRFYLESAIDSGGFGSIYAARQLTLERDVAIKVVEAPTTAAAQLFVNEVRAIGRLDHPNVVRVFQADVTSDGFPFCAMELLSGRSLRSVIDDEGPLGSERASRFAGQLLSALAAVHEAGVIHGDVKPENLILSGEKDCERLVLIDFGVASLQQEAARSVGGTPAYMAPEQLRGRLDPRSDLLAAGLVIHEMLAGALPARRPDGFELASSLPPGLQTIVARSLAADPANRFPSAAAFKAALEGRSESRETLEAAASPFRPFVGFSEADEGAFYGRSDETEEIVAQALLHPVVILTAPSGVGKTSILRAAIIPRLRKLGFGSSYFRCQSDGAISPVAPRSIGQSQEREVVVYDQLEALFLGPAGEQTLDELLERFERTGDQDRAVILSVREDFLARLVERMLPWSLPPILRLSPLSAAGAEEAIVMPLKARHIAVDPDALDTLVAELQRAAAELGPRMGWGAGAFVYPPHLQLICTSLYERAAETEAIGVEHLVELRFSDVIAGHLDRLLDGELSEEQARISQNLLAGLVGPDDTRIPRTENELLAALPAGVDRGDALTTVEFLRQRGLLVPVRVDGQPGWELAHDSLVPRIVEWLDRRQLDRRRAVELLRHHVSRTTADRPYLLSRVALREIEQHPEVVEELDRTAPPRGVSAAELVARSRRALRGRISKTIGFSLVATVFAGYLFGTWLLERRAQAREDALRAANLGRFELVAEPFDWDARRNEPIAVAPADLEPVTLTFYDRDHDAPEEPGERLDAVIATPRPGETGFSVSVEVRGGPAFVKIERRGRPGETCAPSWIRLRWLPGYVERASQPRLRVVYPTCSASLANTVTIPAGEFISGGPGEPPSKYADQPRRIVELPEYIIQRTEVTNAAYAHYASMSELTGRVMITYPTRGRLAGSDGPDRPVANVNFAEATDYCRFLGLQLPANDEWDKAARGGLFLDRAQAAPNPHPERNQPWGPEPWIGRANLYSERDGFWGTAPVGSYPEGASPYGILDMAGNVHEWVIDRAPDQGGSHRMVRGGSFGTIPEDEHHSIAYINARDPRFRDYGLGVRCARRAE